MRLGWVASLSLLCLVAALPGRGRGESCYFSDLTWAEPGRTLRFQAGDAAFSQTLELDVTTGSVVCVTPRCVEPSWDAVTRQILWRDGFGVYALDLARPGATPRALVFFPASSRLFLRAIGSDARGALLLWTLDRATGEHSIWVSRGAELQRLPGSSNGSEALRQWDQRNVATPFRSVGGQFVRSLCVQREEQRLCLEQFGQARRSASPLFRMVLGGPKRLDIVVDRCVPTGVALSADSSRVVMGLLEEIETDGRSEVLSAWVADFEQGTRVYESLLPGRVAVDQRHRVWAFWASRDDLLWCDAGGQLVRISTRPATATLLLPAQASRRSAPIRVVALAGADRESAEAGRRALETAGFEAAIHTSLAGFEVQAGVFADPDLAAARAEALRRRGYPEARATQGGVEDVAPGLTVSVLEDPAGQRYFVRHRQEGHDVFGEIWMQQGEREELVLPAFETALPVGLVELGR